MPITARLIADMISVAGADRLLTMDLHQGQIQGFFNIPVDELTAVHLLSNYFVQKDVQNLVVVTDLGFAKRARAFAELRRRAAGHRREAARGQRRPRPGHSTSSVRCGASAPIIVDDEVDTVGHAQSRPVRALEREGVVEMYACATHGVLSGPAAERIRSSPSARSSSPTRSRSLPGTQLRNLRVLSASRRSSARPSARIHRGESVGALFSSEIQLVQAMLLWGERDEDDDREPGPDRAWATRSADLAERD